MKLKKTLLLSTVLLAIAACTDKDNSVKVEMKSCEGTLCSFDASKSKIKSHSQVLEYNWNFHDDTDMAITEKPEVEHDFNIHVGATLDGNNPDLDLREVSLDEVLTNHHILSKTFKFRTHQHDPKAMFLAKKSEMLGLEDSSELVDLDASESEAGQGSIEEYIWEVDGKKIVTETPKLKQEFTDKSSGDVTLTVVNSFGIKDTQTINVKNSSDADPNEPYFTSEITLTAVRHNVYTNFDIGVSDNFDTDHFTLSWTYNDQPLTDTTSEVVAYNKANAIQVFIRDSKNNIIAKKALIIMRSDAKPDFHYDHGYYGELEFNFDNLHNAKYSYYSIDGNKTDEIEITETQNLGHFFDLKGLHHVIVIKDMDTDVYYTYNIDLELDGSNLINKSVNLMNVQAESTYASLRYSFGLGVNDGPVLIKDTVDVTDNYTLDKIPKQSHYTLNVNKGYSVFGDKFTKYLTYPTGGNYVGINKIITATYCNNLICGDLKATLIFGKESSIQNVEWSNFTDRAKVPY